MGASPSVLPMSNAKNVNRLQVARVVDDRGRKQVRGDAFGKFAGAASSWLGSKWAFVGAVVIIVVWAAMGPIFHYSDTWQLRQTIPHPTAIVTGQLI